jgi:tetratricopeptide (TPR) repeat protein
MADKISHKSLLEQARQLEAKDDLPGAIALYDEALSNDPLTIAAYNRLMIIYRRQKAYKKELDTINKGIKSLEDNVHQTRTAWMKAHRKAAKISQALAKSLGQIDAKGKLTNEDPVITGWKRRKALILKRMKTP